MSVGTRYYGGKLSWKKDQECAWVWAFGGCWEAVPEKAWRRWGNLIQRRRGDCRYPEEGYTCPVRGQGRLELRGSEKERRRGKVRGCAEPCRPLERLWCCTLRWEPVGGFWTEEPCGLIKVLTGSGPLMCSGWAAGVVRAGPGDQAEGSWDNPVLVAMDVVWKLRFRI